MASGSGKDQDDHIQEPVHGHGQQREREGSSAEPAAPSSTGSPRAAAASGGVDASSPPPPPAPPIKLSQEWVHDQAEDGGRGIEGSSSAAAWADWKGKKVSEIPSPKSSSPSSGSSSASITSAADYAAFRGGPSSSAAASDMGVTWRHPVVAGMMMLPEEVRDRFDCEMVFQHMVREQMAIKEVDKRWAELVQKINQEEQVKWSLFKKKPWSKLINYCKDKILRRKGAQIHWGHVDDQTLPITEVINHYFGRGYTALGGVVPSNVMNLVDAYSEFRPVNGDGECFYRAFIFSYLEQVLNRPDKHEEQRLLAAVKRVALQHAHLGWASKFDRSHKAFEKLVKKVMKWKRQGRHYGVASTDSYRKKKLLKFFSTYDTTEDIFVFLRLVAAIWICSHGEEYEPLVTRPRENYSLKDWCFRHVIPRRRFTDHVQMTGLARALEIPLRVEQLNQGPAQDIYTYTDPGVPLVSVTLLFTGNHYDIIYPRPPGGSSSQQTSKGDNTADESSSQQILLG